MNRRPPPRPPSRQLDFGALRPTPIVLRLLIINGAIWFLLAFLVNFAGQVGLARFVIDHLALEPSAATGDFKVWQPFTYMWLHEFTGAGGGLAIGHVLFNMLGLFFLGPPLERRWGARTFLKFYLLTGIIAGVFSVVVGLLIPGWFGGPVIGASGSILALVAAFSLVLPNAEILLMFIIPIRARYIVWIAIGIDVLLFLSSDPSSNNVAFHTHMGGILGAWLLITGNWRPRVAIARFRAWRSKRGGGGPSGPRGGGTGRGGRRGWRVIEGGRRDDDYLH